MSAPVRASHIAGDDLHRLLTGQELHFNHYGRPRLPFAFLGGHGIEIEAVDLSPDRRGTTLRLIDASGGYASAGLGAGHEVVRQALRRAVMETGYATDEVVSHERAALLTRLFGPDGLWSSHFPADEYHVSGRNSGSEGMEMALRLVLESRFDTRTLRYRAGRERRDTILAFEGAWHGWSDGLLPLLNRRHYRVGLPGPSPLDPYGVRVEHIPFGDSEALEEYVTDHGDRLLAVFVEPIQGDAGVLRPPPGYLRRLSELCAAQDVLLVADEVLTFAKSGRFFAMHDDEGPVPTDITVIGKYLGMGALSTSMVIARRRLGVRGSGTVATSDLRPMTCAVIRDGLEFIVRERLLERSAHLGAHLTKRLTTELVERFPDVYHQVRGTGVMHGVELTGAASDRLTTLREHLIRAGVYVEFMAGAGKRSRGLRYVHPTMRVAPALITTQDQADEIVGRLHAGTVAFRAVV
ncbi:aminotransferase class III-fold pyridoxal phosphate-dependent enzyme [Streptomyces sp. CB03238]|uniref:aminotransferase class III-fold pyridoxal phosphate-dependent enzyme n=1 Tax=Streptomyces sp. CB03238 TaxID=1907777 RepID=UPI000A114C3F|nr:aminotransferase class III-fold pyridoxal phosphate-dependent enzyme [Streptomyces sp. CB03238]ORT56738.1 acetylornithine aminotransferase [Streptomyces sp. CB03238]